MSKGDAAIVHASDDDVSKPEIYKDLRRRSTSLALILALSLPLLLLFFNIACTPRRSIGESFRQFYAMIVLDFDCLAIVLGWLLFQVRITERASIRRVALHSCSPFSSFGLRSVGAKMRR